MAITDTPPQKTLRVLPERERVCLRAGAVLDGQALSHLDDEARSLIGRGFTQLTIDLREVETVDWTTTATLAAIGRYAQFSDARVSVIPGSSPAVRELIGSDLLGGLVPKTSPSSPFGDWSR